MAGRARGRFRGRKSWPRRQGSPGGRPIRSSIAQTRRIELAEIQRQFDEAARAWQELLVDYEAMRREGADATLDSVFADLLEHAEGVAERIRAATESTSESTPDVGSGAASAAREAAESSSQTGGSPRPEDGEASVEPPQERSRPASPPDVKDVKKAEPPPPRDEATRHSAAAGETRESTPTQPPPTSPPRGDEVAAGRANLEAKLDQLISLVNAHVAASENSGKTSGSDSPQLPPDLTRRIAREVVQRLKHSMPSAGQGLSETTGDEPSPGGAGSAKSEPARIGFDDIASMIDQITGER